MPSDQEISPGQDEIEVSIFGRGYGEALALHLGRGEWILVDSCRRPESKEPISLEYLKKLGTDVAKDVRLVVATHWHDDHVQGISRIFEQCENAKIAFPSVFFGEEFISLTSLFDRPRPGISSGVDEFSKVFQILRDRKTSGHPKRAPILAAANTLLYPPILSTARDDVQFSVYSLSPSNEDCLRAIAAFLERYPSEGGVRNDIALPDVNRASVAIWIKIGTTRILLGADVESSSDASTGWRAVLEDSQETSGKASVFKIPHHGAASGHADNVWNSLLVKDAYSITTPFMRGRIKLPTDSDIKRILRSTKNAYITGLPVGKPFKPKNQLAARFMSRSTRFVRTLNRPWGHIRLRRRISDSGREWKVELFGAAVKLGA